jgi:putative restriction endonuclease
MPDRTFGEIAGFPAGSTFANRRELAASGVHRPFQGGICGGQDGAESIVVSGGYIDDEDYGDEIIYTGQGGRDPSTGMQVADQKLSHGNAGLARSNIEGLLVRVIRGAGGDVDYSPTNGLRYDGLYRVADFWHASGHNGFRVWRFRLVAHDGVLDPAEADGRVPDPVARRTATIQRLVRNTAMTQRIKEMHGHACQVCGTRIETPAGPYAEGAHIRGLGKPHQGPDEESNVLCLCPNHHVMFDAGAIYVGPDWLVYDGLDDEVIGELRRVTGHAIDPAQLAYHRSHHAP